MSLRQRQICMQNVLSLHAGMTHGRPFSLVLAHRLHISSGHKVIKLLPPFSAWELPYQCTVYWQNVAEFRCGCTGLPTFTNNCTANPLLWKKRLILRLLKCVWYQLKLYCSRVPLLWAGWNGTAEPAWALGLTWSTSASMKKTDASEETEGMLKCPLEVPFSIADVRARASCPQLPSQPLPLSLTLALTWSLAKPVPSSLNQEHMFSSGFISSHFHELGKGHSRELAHPSLCSESLSWPWPYQKPSHFGFIKWASLPTDLASLGAWARSWPYRKAWHEWKVMSFASIYSRGQSSDMTHI